MNVKFYLFCEHLKQKIVFCRICLISSALLSHLTLFFKNNIGFFVSGGIYVAVLELIDISIASFLFAHGHGLSMSSLTHSYSIGRLQTFLTVLIMI